VPAAHDDGTALLAVATERGLEGIVSKRRSSTYVPGSRTREWLKVKIRNTQEFVVGGWSPGDGGRAGTLGALLLGYWEDGALRFAGKVGTGFTAAELRRLQDLLDVRPLDHSPFDPAPERIIARVAHWTRPDLVAQVAFGEWTGTDPPRLRHPSYLGLRDDVDPAAVTRDP
jgi:bifunctional non-homologous end joining protein LigD